MPNLPHLPKKMLLELTGYAASLPQHRLSRTHPYVSSARRVLAYFAETFGIKSAKKIVPRMCSRYVNDRPRLKPSSIATEFKRLRKFLRFLEEHDLKMPVLSSRMMFKAPIVHVGAPFVLTEAEFTNIFKRTHWFVEGNRIEFTRNDGQKDTTLCKGWLSGGFPLMLTLGVNLGLRPYEAVMLSWDELKIDHRTPHLQIADNGIRKPKTLDSTRKLALSEELVKLITTYRDNHLEARAKYLFALPSETAPCGWRHPQYCLLWKVLRQEFELPNLNARFMRRNFCTTIAHATKDPYIAIKSTRHSTPRPLKHYVDRGRNDIIDPRTGKSIDRHNPHDKE